VRTIRHLVAVVFVLSFAIYGDRVNAHQYHWMMNYIYCEVEPEWLDCVGHYTRVSQCQIRNNEGPYWDCFQFQECSDPVDTPCGWMDSAYGDATYLCGSFGSNGSIGNFSCGPSNPPITATFTCEWNEATPCDQ
jgi:hypothetical protein